MIPDTAAKVFCFAVLVAACAIFAWLDPWDNHPIYRGSLDD